MEPHRCREMLQGHLMVCESRFLRVPGRFAELRSILGERRVVMPLLKIKYRHSTDSLPYFESPGLEQSSSIDLRRQLSRLAFSLVMTPVVCS